MAKIRAEIEVPDDKYCDTIDNVCPMLQNRILGGWYCCLFDVDLETDRDSGNGYYPCIRCDECKQAEVEE